MDIMGVLGEVETISDLNQAEKPGKKERHSNLSLNFLEFYFLSFTIYLHFSKFLNA